MHAHTCMVIDACHACSYVHDQRCLPWNDHSYLWFMITNACHSCNLMSSINMPNVRSMPSHAFVLWICFYLVWIRMPYMSVQELIWHTHYPCMCSQWAVTSVTHSYIISCLIYNFACGLLMLHARTSCIVPHFLLRLLKLLLWNSLNYLLQCSDPQYMLQYPQDQLQCSLNVCSSAPSTSASLQCSLNIYLLSSQDLHFSDPPLNCAPVLPQPVSQCSLNLFSISLSNIFSSASSSSIPVHSQLLNQYSLRSCFNAMSSQIPVHAS
jgi:hypothetical protein